MDTLTHTACLSEREKRENNPPTTTHHPLLSTALWRDYGNQLSTSGEQVKEK